MARRGVNPNVDSPPGEEHARSTEWTGPVAEAEREAVRDDSRTSAEALDDVLTMPEADARREVPRTRTDSISPRKDRQLPSPSAVRPALSSRMKKDYNKAKGAWYGNLPKTRQQAIARSAGNQEQLEGLNRSLNGSVGRRSDLPPAMRRRVERLDRAIQDYERDNDRTHVVYSTLRAPVDHGNSRNALRRKLEEMSRSDDRTGKSLTFDGYIPATHTLGQVSDGPDIVMEIRTRSGAYLGTSDTTPNADHLVGRGRVLQPVGVQEVTYVKADGSRGERYVVQMEDITEDGRTEARS